MAEMTQMTGGSKDLVAERIDALKICLDRTITASVAEEMVRLWDEVYKPAVAMQIVFRARSTKMANTSIFGFTRTTIPFLISTLDIRSIAAAQAVLCMCTISRRGKTGFRNGDGDAP